MHFLCALDAVILTLMASMTGVDTLIIIICTICVLAFLYLNPPPPLSFSRAAFVNASSPPPFWRCKYDLKREATLPNKCFI